MSEPQSRENVHQDFVDKFVYRTIGSYNTIYYVPEITAGNRANYLLKYLLEAPLRWRTAPSLVSIDVGEEQNLDNDQSTLDFYLGNLDAIQEKFSEKINASRIIWNNDKLNFSNTVREAGEILQAVKSSNYQASFGKILYDVNPETKIGKMISLGRDRDLYIGGVKQDESGEYKKHGAALLIDSDGQKDVFVGEVYNVGTAPRVLNRNPARLADNSNQSRSAPSA
ncbi:MAG: hypothetical protein V4694_05440 [Pseudomonadota bacterium]